MLVLTDFNIVFEDLDWLPNGQVLARVSSYPVLLYDTVVSSGTEHSCIQNAAQFCFLELCSPAIAERTNLAWNVFGIDIWCFFAEDCIHHSRRDELSTLHMYADFLAHAACQFLYRAPFLRGRASWKFKISLLRCVERDVALNVMHFLRALEQERSRAELWERLIESVLPEGEDPPKSPAKAPFRLGKAC